MPATPIFGQGFESGTWPEKHAVDQRPHQTDRQSLLAAMIAISRQHIPPENYGGMILVWLREEGTCTAYQDSADPYLWHIHIPREEPEDGEHA